MVENSSIKLTKHSFGEIGNNQKENLTALVCTIIDQLLFTSTTYTNREMIK